MKDEISMAEKRKIISEERRISTYRAHAEANADLELGGRFAKLHPTTVTGASPSHQYPQLPADAPSNQLSQMPEEPPLGFDINAMDPTGEVWEQEKSRGDAPASPEAVDAGASDGAKQVGIPVGSVTSKLRRL